MSSPDHISRTDLAGLTQARLTLGPRGRALDTASSLRFALDHAQAREAVLSELDVPSLQQALDATGHTSRVVTSAAGARDMFIRRPDLGRLLPDADRDVLRDAGPVDVALVLGDGLSAIAVALNGVAFMDALARRLVEGGLRVGPVVLARQARVALGDKIAMALGATTVVMALGERPGLSAADSLGIYVTHQPSANTQDSGRNCISNVREAGTSIADAVRQTENLIRAMRETGLSGVTLSQSLAATAVPAGARDAPGIETKR